jgi:hypothetical protein
MSGRGFCLGLAVGTIAICVLGQIVFSAASKEIDQPKGIAPDVVADYIHNVVQADRTFYTEIVEQMQTRGIVSASEDWKQTGDLPLPAQFVLETGKLVAAHPNGIKFRLISGWAVNKKNSPSTEFERIGMAQVLASPARPYVRVTTDGRTRLFQALYADKAISQRCADCHNVHPRSPKRDFKEGDVMGALLITIPLRK